MQTITEVQRKSLEDMIYDCLMTMEVVGNDGEANSLGMGEMGDARKAAELVVSDWMDKNTVTQSVDPLQIKIDTVHSILSGWNEGSNYRYSNILNYLKPE